MVEPWREGLWAALKTATVADVEPATAGEPSQSGDISPVTSSAVSTTAVTVGGDGGGFSVNELKLPKLGPAFIEVASGRSDQTSAECAAWSVRESNRQEWVLGDLHSRRNSTREGAVKRAVDIVVSFDADINYMPGDIFAVACPNDLAECDWLIARLGCKSVADDECVLRVLNGTKKANASIPQHLATTEATSIRRCLGYLCDIRAVSFGRYISIVFTR